MLADTESKFSDMLDAIGKAEDIVVDCETSGLEPWHEDRLCGVGVCLPDYSTYYAAFRHLPDVGNTPLFVGMDDYSDPANLPLSYLPQLMKAISEVPCLTNHNVKFDIAFMHQDGFDTPETQRLQETLTLCRAMFHEEHPKMNLGAAIKRLLGPEAAKWKGDFFDRVPKIKVPGVKGKGSKKPRFDLVPARETAEYCESDTLMTRRLLDIGLEYIGQTDQWRMWDQECELLHVLWNMERTGVYTDQDYLAEMLPKIERKVRESEEVVYKIIGYKFDVESLKQLTVALTSIGLTSPHQTKGGKPKWSLSELIGITEPEGLGMAILNIRALNKTKNTFFKPAMNKAAGSLVHCSFKPWGTGTGRMSCENPNLQNINKALQKLEGNEQADETIEALKAMIGARQGGEVEMVTVSGRKVGGHTMAGVMSMASEYEDDGNTVAVRRVYVPRPGYRLYMFDYSQMEMRVFADYVNDPKLTSMLEDPKGDFHDTVTMAVWGIDKSHNLWDFYRNLAKTVNFGLVYGLGIEKLAIQIQKSVEEAEEFKQEYFARFPKAKDFIKGVSNVIRDRGRRLGTYSTFVSKKDGKEYKVEDRSPGWVANRFGRRYVLPQRRNYVGVNYLVQGSSADIVKNRMVAVDRFILENRLKSRLLIQVHDELDMEIHVDEEQWFVPKVVEIMQERQIKTLLPVEASRGFPSWAHKHKVCLKCLGPMKKDKETKTTIHHCWAPGYYTHDRIDQMMAAYAENKGAAEVEDTEVVAAVGTTPVRKFNLRAEG
jgi:DNA polymerase I-like protein with 3'-5' exonuclease and polymerase domains